ncbi:hypothetical protein Tco_0940435 [Tanacetum coccineum]|uniref:Uncharacterized protein n=1 Tax=Tanacetum coccineum TaxID=301880 RepID=A0ABQ5DNL7_9ASTR
MATLKYSDKHNMVAFLKKPNESVGFTEIVDFLKGTSLRYSLTHNPTIYDSLVKQFWQTATIRTLANGIQELVASIDNTEYTITEAFVKSKLQLADATGISNLPDAEIYDGLATLGHKSGGWDQFDSPIATALICLSREHVPLLPAMLAGAAEDQGEGSANPAKPNPTPIDPSQSPTFTNVADEATTTGVGVGTEGATTTTSGLDAGLDSGNIHESLLRIDTLEKELHHTKTTYGKAILTLVERVKSLEVALKRKTKKVVVSEDEEIENQGRKIQDIDDDPLVSLVRESMEEKAADFITLTKISASGEVQEEDISPGTLEAAKTLSQVVSQRARSTDKGKRYKRKTRTTDKDISTSLDAEVEVSPGRVIISSSSAGVNTGSTPVSTPSIVQKIRQEEVDLAEAMRFLALQDEEAARQVHLDALLAKRISEEQELSEQQEKRKPEVQEEAQHYSEEYWDNVRAKLEANAELVKDVLGENVTSNDFTKRMNQGTWKPTQLKKLTFAELKAEFEKLVRSIASFVLKDSEIEKTRVKRAGIELLKESSKKQKTIGIEEESAAEPIVAKEEEIEEQIKKRGKRKKQKARKGIHADKTAQHKVEEDMEALVKANETDSSLGTDIPISVVPEAIKPPSIANCKIIKLGKKGVYQIIREDRTYTTYINFGAMLKSISMDDLIKLYRLVMQRVHCLNLESADIYMLTERRYPLPADVCQAMLSKKLQGDKKDEACYQLLKLIEKQAQNKLP